MKRFVFLVLGFVGAMGWAVPALAQTTVKFQQGSNGYSGAMDTYIDKFDAQGGNDFFGGVERIEIRSWDAGATEKMNVLIMFDVSSLPSNATVTSAKLTLYNIRERGESADDVVILGKVTSAWNNQSTWNMGVPSVVASGVTCPPVTPGYAEDPATPPPASEAYVINGLASLVQGWRAMSGTNYGVMLSCTSNLNFRFASSEYATVSVRPELTVTYTTPNTTPPPTVTVTSAPSTTTSSPITVSGTASATSPATVTQITWLNTLTGATGTASGTTSWTADIPLGRGPNTIVITVTDSNSGTGSASFSVDYTPPPKVNKGNSKICGLGAAGEFTGSFTVAALALSLLLVAAARRPA
jgi:hypothetical protein